MMIVWLTQASWTPRRPYNFVECNATSVRVEMSMKLLHTQGTRRGLQLFDEPLRNCTVGRGTRLSVNS